MYRVLLCLCVALLIACNPRATLIEVPDAADIGKLRSVFVGTTRAFDPETGSFGDGRLRIGTNFARFDVSIPPDRKLGEITWPKPHHAPDPTHDFLITKSVIYDGATPFRKELAARLALQKSGGREVTVFTHGFNTTFGEGLYRIAQMSEDLDLPGVMVHYSWPSAGKPLAYVRDRDSALFARDGLETLLREVAAAGAERIVIVGHSMGAALTMETLRQMALQGDRQVRPLIGGIILLSPDIDVDVFHAQARTIGKLPQPFLIFTSRKDKALALSARLTGQRRDRLGNLRDVSDLADLDVTIVDVAAFSTGDGHLTVGDSPALIRLLSRIGDIDTAFSNDRTGRPGLFPGVVLTLQNATSIILRPITGGSN